MADQMYRQCLLESPTEEGTRKLVSWIPENHKGVVLKPGVQVNLEGDEGWWTVTSVGDNRLPRDYVRERSRDYTRHRAATDI